MKDQVKIFRPQKVGVTIFDETHEMHRLTRGDVVDLAAIFMANRRGISDVSPEGIKRLVVSCGEILQRLMELSFPTFGEWHDLPVADELALFELVWQENDLPAIIENFTKLGERIKPTPRKEKAAGR